MKKTLSIAVIIFFIVCDGSLGGHHSRVVNDISISFDTNIPVSVEVTYEKSFKDYDAGIINVGEISSSGEDLYREVYSGPVNALNIIVVNYNKSVVQDLQSEIQNSAKSLDRMGYQENFYWDAKEINHQNGYVVTGENQAGKKAYAAFYWLDNRTLIRVISPLSWDITEEILDSINAINAKAM
jgi:hypothetical protein